MFVYIIRVCEAYKEKVPQRSINVNSIEANLSDGKSSEASINVSIIHNLS